MFLKRTTKVPTLDPRRLAEIAHNLGPEDWELDSSLHDETASDRLFAHEANRKGQKR